MPTLRLIMERAAAAFGLEAHQVGTFRPTSEAAVRAQRVFAWLADELTDVNDDRIGRSLGWSEYRVRHVVGGITHDRLHDPAFRRRLDQLAVEICAETLAAARLKLPLQADPDPAHTAARLLAGGATAATVSEDALRGLALAFLALAAGDPSTPVQEASNHG